MSGIVSLVPSMTEIAYCLGLGPQIVGVTEHCNFPDTAKAKTKVGTFAQPGLAEIVALKPDLVLADAVLHQRLADELRESKIEVLASTPANVPDVLELMSKLAQLCSIESQAAPIIEGFKQRVENLRQKVPNLKPRVLRLMTTDPFIIPGPGSFQQDAIAMAGGRQMEVSQYQPYVQVAWEQIVTFDPEIILFCGVAPGQKLPVRCKGCTVPSPVCQRTIADIITKEWETLSAVKQNRVYPIACHTICRPGPRLFDGMEFLHQEYFRY